MPYLAAIVISLSMSGGPVGGKVSSLAGSPTSTGNPSNPAGVLSRSILAGAPFPLPRTRGGPRVARRRTRRPRFHPLVSDVERHFALDDVEGLVLVAMYVVRPSEPGRKHVIDEAESAAGVLAGRLHYHEGAKNH